MLSVYMTQLATVTNNISFLLNKKEQLRIALNEVNETLSNQRQMLQKISNLEVVTSRWYGEVTEKMLTKYDDYVSQLQTYITNLEQQRDVIQEELHRTETGLYNAYERQRHLKSMISSLQL